MDFVPCFLQLLHMGLGFILLLDSWCEEGPPERKYRFAFWVFAQEDFPAFLLTPLSCGREVERGGGNQLREVQAANNSVEAAARKVR